MHSNYAYPHYMKSFSFSDKLPLKSMLDAYSILLVY